jgi:hypothetical protein
MQARDAMTLQVYVVKADASIMALCQCCRFADLLAMTP